MCVCVCARDLCVRCTTPTWAPCQAKKMASTRRKRLLQNPLAPEVRPMRSSSQTQRENSSRKRARPFLLFMSPTYSCRNMQRHRVLAWRLKPSRLATQDTRVQGMLVCAKEFPKLQQRTFPLLVRGTSLNMQNHMSKHLHMRGEAFVLNQWPSAYPECSGQQMVLHSVLGAAHTSVQNK